MGQSNLFVPKEFHQLMSLVLNVTIVGEKVNFICFVKSALFKEIIINTEFNVIFCLIMN